MALTLWDSRYKSSLIQAETYLFACQRYIELTPCAPPWSMTLPTITGLAIGVNNVKQASLKAGN